MSFARQSGWLRCRTSLYFKRALLLLTPATVGWAQSQGTRREISPSGTALRAVRCGTPSRSQAEYRATHWDRWRPRPSRQREPVPKAATQVGVITQAWHWTLTAARSGMPRSITSLQSAILGRLV